MKLSKHAKVWPQQRGVSYKRIHTVISLGTPIRKPGNAVEYRIDDKEIIGLINYYKECIKNLEKCRKISAIVNGDTDNVVTVYRQN